MIKHFFKTIFKSLKKSGKITLFNLIGLSVSFAAFILLAIFLWNEFTFDHYHKKTDDLYMLELTINTDGLTESSCFLPNPMADAIKEGIPEIDNLCSLYWGPGNYSTEKDGENKITISTRAVDSTFTDMFSLEIIRGSQTPLRGTDKIILSESTALRTFGDTDPVGKTIWGNFNSPYLVEAVFKDIPENSSFNYDAFCSYPTDEWVNAWSEYSFNHMFELSGDSDPAEISKKILSLPEIAEHQENSTDFSFTFIPMGDLHFDKNWGNGNKTFVMTLLLVAFLLIFMAFTNYLNFAFASAPKVLKSVNIRRVVGESKVQQRSLFVFETVVLILFSFILANLLAYGILKLWPDMFAYKIRLADYIILQLVCFAGFILIGILCAWFPARMVSGVEPAMALKGQLKFLPKRRTTGNVLTIFQYTISIILIIGVLFIQKQVNYMRNFDLGFQKENILVVDLTPSIMQQEDAFTGEIMQNPGIIDYSCSQFVPGGVGMGWGREIDGKYVNFKCWPVDERYINLMGMEIVEGRNFLDNIEADENNFIFNQKALQEFGWIEDYLGKSIPGFDFSGKLVGVIKDINFASLHGEIEPMAFWVTKERHNLISLKIKGENVDQTIKHIKTVYEKFEHKYNFEYTFLNQTLDAQYKNDRKQGKLILIFSVISILISVVGVLGIIIFMSEYRMKEMGIRKVNGASLSQIMLMLNKDVFLSVTIAFIIASPLSYFAVKTWMSAFAYQTEISWWVFVFAGIVSFAIALFTVSWQSWKAATRNPVDSLHYE